MGFDTKGAGSMVVKGSRRDRTPELVKIPDSREGWVESVRLLLDSYFHGNPCPEFDYSLIRKAGEPIKVTARLFAPLLSGGAIDGAVPRFDSGLTLDRSLRRGSAA